MVEYSIVDILGGIADIGTKATPSDAFGCSLEYGIGGWIGYVGTVPSATFAVLPTQNIGVGSTINVWDAGSASVSYSWNGASWIKSNPVTYAMGTLQEILAGTGIAAKVRALPNDVSGCTLEMGDDGLWTGFCGNVGSLPTSTNIGNATADINSSGTLTHWDHTVARGWVRRSVTTAPGYNLVRFLDADGTVLAAQSIVLGGNATPPSNPQLDPALTFDGWTGAYTNVQAPIDIIASYHPTDGYTHYNIALNSITGLTTTMYFSKSDGSTLTVDWGDGTVVTSTATGNATLSHTFAAAGNYSVRAAITSGSGTIQMGQGTLTTQVFGPTQVDILQSVWMRASQTAVGDYAFQSYRGLDYVLGSGVTSIGTRAFQYCSAATSFNFPAATSIGVNAFQYCYAATSFNFPAATSIGANTFQSCYAATSFNFPVATSIGVNAFQFCYSATSFNFPVATSIGTNAFQGCRMLLTATFGASAITLVDSYAFDGDFALTSITFGSTTPPTLTSTNAFSLSSFATIYVPTASVDAYKAATNWASFANRIVGY